MKKLNFKKVIIGSSAVIGLLFVILIVHLIIVMKPVDMDNSTSQMSRIEFDQTPDENELAILIPTLKAKDGMQIVKFFPENNYLVTAFDNTKLSNDQLMKIVDPIMNAPAKLFVPTAAMNASACPVLSKNSLSYQLGMIVKKIFY